MRLLRQVWIQRTTRWTCGTDLFWVCMGLLGPSKDSYHGGDGVPSVDGEHDIHARMDRLVIRAKKI